MDLKISFLTSFMNGFLDTYLIISRMFVNKLRATNPFDNNFCNKIVNKTNLKGDFLKIA